MIYPIVESLLVNDAGLVNTHAITIPTSFTAKDAPFTIYTVEDENHTYSLNGVHSTKYFTVNLDIYSSTIKLGDIEFQKILTALDGIRNKVVGSYKVWDFSIISVIDSFDIEFELYLKTITTNIIIQ